MAKSLSHGDIFLIIVGFVWTDWVRVRKKGTGVAFALVEMSLFFFPSDGVCDLSAEWRRVFKRVETVLLPSSSYSLPPSQLSVFHQTLGKAVQALSSASICLFPKKKRFMNRMQQQHNFH